MKKKYQITASYTTFLETVVEAENEEEAVKLAEIVANEGGMNEVDPFDSDFSIDSVKLMEDQQ